LAPPPPQIRRRRRRRDVSHCEFAIYIYKDVKKAKEELWKLK
jgi:hypothetical protein